MKLSKDVDNKPNNIILPPEILIPYQKQEKDETIETNNNDKKNNKNNMNDKNSNNYNNSVHKNENSKVKEKDKSIKNNDNNDNNSINNDNDNTNSNSNNNNNNINNTNTITISTTINSSNNNNSNSNSNNNSKVKENEIEKKSGKKKKDDLIHETSISNQSLNGLKTKSYSKSLNESSIHKYRHSKRNKYLKGNNSREDRKSMHSHKEYRNNSIIDDDIKQVLPFSLDHSKFSNNIFITNEDDSSSKNSNNIFRQDTNDSSEMMFLNATELFSNKKDYTESTHSSSEYITIKNTNDLLNEKQMPSMNETLTFENNENNGNTEIIGELDTIHPIYDNDDKKNTNNSIEITVSEKLENQRPSTKYLKTKKSNDKSNLLSLSNNSIIKKESLVINESVVIPEKHKKSITENLGFNNIEQLQNEFAEFMKSYSKNKEINENKSVTSFHSQKIIDINNEYNKDLIIRINSIDSDINESSNISKNACRTPSHISKNDIITES